MTWNNPPKMAPRKPKKGKIITPEMLAASGSEDGEQAALFCWAADSVGKYPQLKWLFAIPNGGSRHIAEATKFVATGTRSGVPDLMLPYAMHKRDYQGFGEAFKCGYHGCFIEMKVNKNRPTKEQDNWLEYLSGAGYACFVCNSWQEARDRLIDYLEGRVRYLNNCS